MKLLIKLALPVLLIAGAYFGAAKMISSKPPLESKQPAEVIPQVDSISVSPGTFSPPVKTFGTVQSFFETTLSPQVSGRITSVSDTFRVGSKVNKGELLARIDPTDYLAALSRSSATVETNKRQVAEEEIRARQAQQDWIASGRSLNTASDFVLRKPQLTAAKANLESSKAAFKKAQADLERCKITAPFDAIITQRSASVGNFASAQSALGQLISTAKAEVRLPLTATQSRRIFLPKATNNSTKITLATPTQPGQTWNATLTRTEPVVNPQNQVLYVIAEIESPFSDTSPLPIGTFVNARIPSKPITNVLELPESAIVNDSFLWLVTQEKTLSKANVERIYSFEGKAYVRLTAPQSEAPFTVVARPLTNFRTDMKVNTEAKTENAPQ